MNGGKVTPALQEFVEHREAVINFIRSEMINQGIPKLDASMAVARIKLWNTRDVENLYRTITSDMPEYVIKSIVAHDFQGLYYQSAEFVPKSRQFDDRKE